MLAKVGQIYGSSDGSFSMVSLSVRLMHHVVELAVKRNEITLADTFVCLFIRRRPVGSRDGEMLGSERPVSLCVVLLDVGSERVLDLSQPLHSQMVYRNVGKRPAVYLRYDEPNPTGGFIRIYPKGLRYRHTVGFRC